jgi:hypothetical protein
MRKIDELKIKCKGIAAEIRSAKAELKDFQKDKQCLSGACSWKMSKLHYTQLSFRCYHIAYCELRGKTREQIEPKVKEFNAPDQNLIDKIKADYAWETKEIA